MLGFLTPPPDIRQPVIVERDSGGLVSSYQKAVIQYNLENRRVEIRGSCNSACTLALGVKNVCVGKGAIIRWAAGKIILSPPLVFTRQHVDEAVAVLDHALTCAQEGRT